MKSKFTGGALSFKGDKTKAKKKKSKSKHKSDTTTTEQQVPADSNKQVIADDMTEAERKAMARKKERETKDLEKMAQKSHRATIEEFNEKLGQLTEHNDIPRVRCINRIRSIPRSNLPHHTPLHFVIFIVKSTGKRGRQWLMEQKREDIQFRWRRGSFPPTPDVGYYPAPNTLAFVFRCSSCIMNL